MSNTHVTRFRKRIAREYRADTGAETVEPAQLEEWLRRHPTHSAMFAGETEKVRIRVLAAE